MTQGFTQSGPTTSPCQLSSESSSTILSGTVESMGYDQFDASQTTATSAVSSGMNSVGQEFITQAGPSTSPLQGCNGQSSVQSRHIKSPFMLEDASEDEKFMKKMHSGVRSAHSISGNQHQLHGAGKRQSTSRKPDSPYMSPSRLLDIDLEAAMEVVVASIISDEWRTLLHHLGLSELELETLQNKETPEAACEAGLKLWRETRGQEVTTERLVRAVKDTKVKLRNGADLDTAFEIVSKDLWSDWERLARTMGFTQSDVDSIKSGSPDQPYEQCWQLLYRWRDREGQRATLQALMQQLRVAGFHETSEKLDIGDMSDQEEHGASKKSWDDSESSSDSDSDSDGDDNSMKGAVSIRSKMKQLKKGKRQVPDPQWSTVKGVKRKKMEDDGDVEMHMVKQTGVTTSDSTVPAEEATDDLSFMLTPADIKCWQDAMKTHVLSTSRVSLEEQFRFNMLVMHLIKDEYYHKHLCCYWNDKGSLPVYRVQLSHQGKVLYSVQAKEGENKDMTFDLTCSGNITENIHALSLVLPVGHRVQQADVEQLELGVCLIGDEEVALLAEMFCYLPCLKHLDLSNNMITSSGALAVAAHISHLQQLEWLDLSGNNIGEVGVTAMNEKLVNLEKLKYVNFNMNSVTVNMRTCLLLTLSNMENLSEVNLSTERSFYLYLLGVYNNKGNRLTIRTGDADVVSLVDQVFSQVYRVELSWRGKVLYSVQADGGLRGEPTQDDIRSDMCW
uniref:Death domain-containing protein n=1 Tax=Branchiostoma floridae TaxID=7739 RepID=C3Y5I1_BRAFL|eukprot:XP_002608218.1 hypothetical protein BRAFLDRAFT_87869 [Branchiostoma floridae]